jgi:hyperosmotically inducible periplasmic protein
LINRLIRSTCYCCLLLVAPFSHAALTEQVEHLEQTQNKVASYFKDSQITANVKSQLLDKVGADVADIEVSTNQGRVTLTGFVPNQHLRRQLTRLSKAVAGVKQVDNQVQLLANRPATLKGFARDTLITSDIKARLFSDSHLDSQDIKVTTRNGEVFLSGTVSAAQTEKLAELVKKLSSAQRIHNHVQVKK